MPAQTQTKVSSQTNPGECKILTVREVADRLRVTDRHVINLIEEGKLVAFDIAGRNDFVRVPMAAVEEIARRLNTPPESLLAIIKAAKPTPGNRRAFWRVPLVEGLNAFMQQNHSLNLR